MRRLAVRLLVLGTLACPGCLVSIGDVESGAANDAGVGGAAGAGAGGLGGAAGIGGMGGSAGADAGVDAAVDAASGAGGSAGQEAGVDAAPDAKSPAETYAAEVAKDAPLLYWRLDELSGTTANDSSGNGSSGLLHGAVAWTATGAMPGSAALKFDGGRIEGVDAFDFTGMQPFSFEAWVELGPTQVQYARVISKDLFDSAGRQGWGLLFDTGVLQFERWRDGGGDFANGTWPTAAGFVHIVATYDGSVMRLYLDGEQKGSDSNTKTLVDVAKPLTVGAFNANSNVLAGSIDEVAIYDHALALERVQAHFKAAQP